jgi:hypothetical protein
MKVSDNFTVQALIVALSQIEQPLDSHIQSELNQISADWKNNSDWQEDIDVIKQIRRVVSQYPVLKVPYDAALEELYDNYQTPQFSIEANIDNDFQPFDWLTAVKMVLGSAESVSTAKIINQTKEDQENDRPVTGVQGSTGGSVAQHLRLDGTLATRLLQMNEAQTLSIFPEVDLLTRHTSTSLGIYTRDSYGGHKITYLQHPKLSTKDEPSLLRVPPVALPPQD